MKKLDLPFWTILFLGIALIIFALIISDLEKKLDGMEKAYDGAMKSSIMLFNDYKNMKNRHDWLKKRVKIQEMELKGIRMK